jgi:UDP-N-acetylglucosamine/UDP-N-acetylgalactosamine diphosphorylase
MPAPAELVDRLARYGQEHVVRFWDELGELDRANLKREIDAIDWGQIDRLIDAFIRRPDRVEFEMDFERIRPPRVERLPRTDAERSTRRIACEIGASALSAGKVAVVLVAGGQGTRLGFDGPKGSYPIGPVSNASLFQIHAEKIAAVSRKFGKCVPLYMMTSPDNTNATEEFWSRNRYFGLEHVRIFEQGRLPAVDRESGKVLLAEKGRIALSPSGHGGTLAALAAAGSDGMPSPLEEMARLGIDTIFYFQVDNPMVKIADPSFIGPHLQANAEASFKVIEKIQPDEKLGVVVEYDGGLRVIEYSDLPARLGEEREPDGSLRHWAGSIAVHLFERSFLERLAAASIELPFHRAVKKVQYIDDKGTLIVPDAPNAIKFESFIFDTLPLAERSVLVETDRSVEFEPLKNATGPDSPTTVRTRMTELFAGWLEGAGARVERSPDGSIPFGIEISPLFALSASELKSKIEPGLVVNKPLHLK